jgi:hypothetical protein
VTIGSGDGRFEIWRMMGFNMRGKSFRILLACLLSLSTAGVSAQIPEAAMPDAMDGPASFAPPAPT